MKFIITAHPEKDKAQEAKDSIEKWLKEKSHEVVSGDEEADLAVVLGGDGFVMHNIAKFSQKDIPCLGINAGEVGFLTSGNLSEWQEILEKVLENNYKVEERIGLELEMDSKKFGPFANDVYLKHPTSMVSLNIKVDSERIYRNLNSDGVIVSTPTGSTGYNVSAGGPIIQPGIFSLVLTPICPVHLNIRSLVINPNSEIEIEFLGSRNSEPVYLVADGQTIDEISNKNRKIIVRQHSKKLLFAVLDKHHFYKALQDKKGLMK